MPRPAKINGTDKPTKLLGALVHWVMHNNLLTVLNSYTKWQAHIDFIVSYTVFKRVISGVWQHRGSYYKKLEQEQVEGDDGDTTPKRKRKAPNPVDVALAKKRKVTSSADMAECKYCGKSYRSSKKLTEHINMEHTGDQSIFACLYCSQPFNQYTVY